jgi:ankyrin repeat protein
MVNSIFDPYYMYQINEIFKAAERGDVKELSDYLENGGNINAQDPVFGLTIFQVAIANHNVDFARAVGGSPNFDPFQRDKAGRSALDIAHATGNSTMVDIVLQHLGLDD